jgi:hypothetical protein
MSILLDRRRRISKTLYFNFDFAFIKLETRSKRYVLLCPELIIFFVVTTCRKGVLVDKHFNQYCESEIRDTGLFYPLDLGSGSGMKFFRIPDPG